MSGYISQAFDQWISGFPTEALIMVITRGCAAWLLSLVQATRRQINKGAQ